jgi:hypothetical protein
MREVRLDLDEVGVGVGGFGGHGEANRALSNYTIGDPLQGRD